MNASEAMQDCIDACLQCYRTCLSEAMNHCLEVQGPHTEPNHFKLMLACAEMCRTSAHFMLIGTPHHKHTCAECAEICRQCADSCQQVGDMQVCVDACNRCADECSRMAA